MVMNTPKDELIKMLVNKTLFGFLMKKNLIKKGDMVCYGRILGISTEDLREHFEKNGYPELNVPRKLIKSTPEGSEGDVVWTLNNGVYKVWQFERGEPFEEFSTESKPAFETYWKDHILKFMSYHLNNEWRL